MRRSLAVASVGLAAAATFAPVGSASARPQPVCDIAQNCLCLVAATVVYTATGYQLHCV